MSKEAAVLANAQVELYGKISRTTENLRKGGPEKRTLGAVEARLQMLEAHWVKFVAQDDKIFEFKEVLRANPYYEQDVPSLAEEEYLKHKGQLLDIIRSARSREENAQPTVTVANPPAPRTTLPRIQLPTFSGKYEDWPSFRDLFESVVSRDAATTRVEKLHYLKTCLKGEAELLVRNLSTTSENYDTAWKALIGYYENKRLLTRSYLTNFLSLQKMKAESASDLRNLFHHIKSTVKSLANIDRAITNSEDLFVYLSVELLDARSRREWETSISDTTVPPSYDILEQFLERRLHTLEALTPLKTDGHLSKTATGTPKSSRSYLTQKPDSKTDQRGRCSLCHNDHFIMLCADYKKKTASERKQHVIENDLCLNCLGRHKVNECASKKSCSACGERHHTSVHDACREVATIKTAHVSRRSSPKTTTALLATARVLVADRFGTKHRVRALIDQGSETSMITESLAQRLRLPRSSGLIAIFGIGGRKIGTANGYVTLSISPHFGGPSSEFEALIFPRITVFTGGLPDRSQSWDYLQDLELADPEYTAADPVDILLGVDAYTHLICDGMRKGKDQEPLAQRTIFGWILSGGVANASRNSPAHALQCRIEADLSNLVRRFWDQEELPRTVPLTAMDQECEDHYQRTHARASDGRYIVRLPIKEPLPDLLGTRRAAGRVLGHMETKFRREESFQKLYCDFMQQYLDLGHMSLASDDKGAPARTCYLPHHGVLRTSSSSTKLRVVFNGSSPLPSGQSLNSHLHTGENLLPVLADIILQWRQHRYVFASDIEKMYRQILIHPDDRDLQRIVWRHPGQHEVREFRLNTVTYGLACAPFLAIRTLRQLADDEGQRFPYGAAILRKEVYMDDILSGAATMQEAKDKRDQLISICTAGGLPLKKWSSNTWELLDNLPAEDRLQSEQRWWQPGESHSTLGLLWHPHDDLFSFSTRQVELSSVTKRTVLSMTAKLFDPLGWLSPATVRAKIYFQATWLLGMDWDTPLPDEHTGRWVEFQRELPALETIRIPRWLGSKPNAHCQEIHGFADASERAYAAVTYLRTVDETGEVEVRILLAKTKVAPLKQVSLPRLELCAATLLVRLVTYIRQVIDLREPTFHLWSDSTVALSWIRGHPTSWKTYVANRVSEIQTSLPDAIWHHIPGQENPADCASRGLAPSELESHTLWWHGPSWLQADTPFQEGVSPDVDEECLERRIRSHAVAAIPDSKEESPILTRFSALHRLIRVTALCRRWLTARRGPDGNCFPSFLQADELNETRTQWIRLVQHEHFKAEIAALRRGRPLPTSSSLRTLNPTLDDRSLLRVSGRLRNAPLSRDTIHSIILPPQSHLTKLIITAHHRRTLHGGVQLTLGSLRQEFWLPRGRALVKECIHRCTTCIRWRAATIQPLMGSLPTPRVTPSRPFYHTGVDYAGPIWLRTSKGRGHKASKAFLVIFVCLSSRAVHLDVASDYTADAFLAALRRFVSRRGLCYSLYSDCGTNFVGADAQLRSMFTAATNEGKRLAGLVCHEGIRWHFNPPAAPHFGGVWEAAVKSVKHHLRRVIGDTKLTFEEMSTLLSQIEACLNSRPLQALTDDPNDFDALTPGHFLVGSALNAVPEPSLLNTPESHTTRWQLLQKLRDHFWSRWAREYLSTLTHRPKWFQEKGSISIGRLCLVKSENTPPTKWPLARIDRLHTGQDGQTRVVDIRTSTSTLTRPVNKLILLPVSSAPERDA